jgi:predicted metal-binding protein
MTPRRARAGWSTAILVCRKCSKKLKRSGFGPDGDQPLAKALRKQLHLGKGFKANAGIVEVGCLDLCPKHAVTVVDTRHPGQWLIIRPGADLDQLAQELNLKEDD